MQPSSTNTSNNTSNNHRSVPSAAVLRTPPALNPIDRLFNGVPQVGVGVYDGMSALLAEKWNFDFMWVSSFCCSATAGLPDAGLISPEDILNIVRCVRRCVQLPIVVDLDSGYGDAVKVCHVVEAMATAGAAALCIEDNPLSKRCSLYDGYDRVLVSTEEHIARLRAAKVGVTRAASKCRIIARTEALVAGMGVAEALRRATAYVDAGADAVFIQSLDATGDEVLSFGRQWQRRTPLFIAPTPLATYHQGRVLRSGNFTHHVRQSGTSRRPRRHRPHVPHSGGSRILTSGGGRYLPRQDRGSTGGGATRRRPGSLSGRYAGATCRRTRRRRGPPSTPRVTPIRRHPMSPSPTTSTDISHAN